MSDLAATIVAEGGAYSLQGGWWGMDHQALVFFYRADGQLRKGLGRHRTDPDAALRAAYDEARKALTL